MDYDEMGGPLTEGLAGPLVGGGTTQVGTLAAKLIWKDKAGVQKWAPSIGMGLGMLVSGILAFRPQTREIGIVGLITSALIGVPRQLEELLMDGGATQGLGLGAYTAEEMMGAGAEDVVEMLGDNGMGVVVPEQGIMGQDGGSPVELLGNAGFGANFLQ